MGKGTLGSALLNHLDHVLFLLEHSRQALSHLYQQRPRQLQPLQHAQQQVKACLLWLLGHHQQLEKL